MAYCFVRWRLSFVVVFNAAGVAKYSIRPETIPPDTFVRHEHIWADNIFQNYPK